MTCEFQSQEQQWNSEDEALTQSFENSYNSRVKLQQQELADRIKLASFIKYSRKKTKNADFIKNVGLVRSGSGWVAQRHLNNVR